MDKHALVVMSEHGEQNPGGQGRMLHALQAAREFKAAGVPAEIFFHGIGVQWLTAFAAPSDRYTEVYGPLFEEVRDMIGGACDFCAAKRFDAADAAKSFGVPLLGGDGEHHTVAQLVADGYRPIVF